MLPSHLTASPEKKSLGGAIKIKTANNAGSLDIRSKYVETNYTSLPGETSYVVEMYAVIYALTKILEVSRESGSYTVFSNSQYTAVPEIRAGSLQ